MHNQQGGIFHAPLSVTKQKNKNPDTVQGFLFELYHLESHLLLQQKLTLKALSPCYTQFLSSVGIQGFSPSYSFRIDFNFTHSFWYFPSLSELGCIFDIWIVHPECLCALAGRGLILSHLHMLCCHKSPEQVWIPTFYGFYGWGAPKYFV